MLPETSVMVGGHEWCSIIQYLNFLCVTGWWHSVHHWQASCWRISVVERQEKLWGRTYSGKILSQHAVLCHSMLLVFTSVSLNGQPAEKFFLTDSQHLNCLCKIVTLHYCCYWVCLILSILERLNVSISWICQSSGEQRWLFNATS